MMTPELEEERIKKKNEKQTAIRIFAGIALDANANAEFMENSR